MREDSPTKPTFDLRAKLLLLAWIPLLVAVDQYSKAFAVSDLEPRRHLPPISLLADTLRLQYAENFGAFGSLGAGLSETQRFWLFTVVNGTLLAGVCGFLITHRNIEGQLFISLALILAGGIGNAIDRMTKGYVVDFLNVGIGWLRTHIFNVADMYILLGTAILFLHWIRNPQPSNDSATAPQSNTPYASSV